MDSFQADVDGNGSIDYIEFITATMHRHRLERDEHLHKAFQYFDKDNSGRVDCSLLNLCISRSNMQLSCPLAHILYLF